MKHTFYVQQLFSENRAVYEIMSKNMVEPEGTNDVTTWRMRVACWISKVTCTQAHAHAHAPGNTRARAHTHAQICNTYCFSTATMLRERAPVLLYKYIVCLV
jgi:hypothetical protein